MVVVFHGSGQIGTDNKSQLGILPKLFAGADMQAKYPAYILAPQFATRSSDYVTDPDRKILSSQPRPCLQAALQLINTLKTDPDIDSNRIYVIGFSMGGSTVINAMSAIPGLFAAGVSISGIPQFNKIESLSATPVWLIHGIEDTENPIASDEQFYKELNSFNKIRFWRMKGTTHDNIFSQTILGETIPKWLFKQKRK